MSRYNLIKVIKRVEREQSVQEAVEATRAQLSVPEKAREQAETVKEWISEYRQTRLTRQRELKQQLGW